MKIVYNETSKQLLAVLPDQGITRTKYTLFQGTQEECVSKFEELKLIGSNSMKSQLGISTE